MAKALLAGGIRVLEVTLRTPPGPGLHRGHRQTLPEAIVGAGTVRNAADAAAATGRRRFAVSPGYTSKLGQACRDLDLPLLPGVATSSEI
jgi:2-dehydro-3-deoxyphosphogluconate aldolase/(4S)-4-hydroxy-2-oxoglutarate aldolase